MKAKLKTIRVFFQKYWLFIFLSFLVALLIFIKYSQKEKPKIEPIVPEESLTLVTVDPLPGEHQNIWGSYPIKFTFDQSLKEDSLNYQVAPHRESLVKWENQGKTLAIYPKIGWHQSIQYQITINELESESGRLLEPITYSFIIVPPKTYDAW